MERMERNLHEAAKEGSVTSFLRLLQEDELVLDRFLAGCYTETPLHIAAMLGHLEFTKEILSRKPGLAGELDFRRSAPLQLATANGHLDVVKALLSVNPEMCLALDRYGRNPLHIAVIKGRVEVLTELVQAKPEAAQVRVDRGETILHLCVKHYQLEALKVLVEMINDRELINSKDDDSSTVLHLAVANKQIESVKFLITKTAIDVNALNCNGFTALDIALACGQRGQRYIDIQDSLQCAGAVRAQDISSSSVKELEAISTGGLSSGTTNQTTALHTRGSRNHKQHHRMQNNSQTTALGPRDRTPDQHHSKQNNWLENKRNALMVVASLLATMAFQAGTNPPGGVWQEDMQNGCQNCSAGSSIMAHKYHVPYTLFVACSTTCFLASLGVILLLIGGLPCKCKFFMGILMVTMSVAIISMALTYGLSLIILIPQDFVTTIDHVLYVPTIAYYVLAAVPTIACSILLGFLLLGHIIRFIIKMVICAIRLMRRLMRRGRKSSSSIMMNQATV